MRTDPIYGLTPLKVTDVSGNQSVQTRNVTKASGYPAVYDGNGNLQSRTTTQGAWVYTWNALNQLVSASLGSTTVLQNWYDAYGRRIAKQEVIGTVTSKRYYVYDGWTVIAVLDGANGTLLESYTRGIGLAWDVGTLVAARHHAGTYFGQVLYLHANHRGDVIMARSGATTVGTYDYAPYGALRSTSGAYDSRFKFSSKERDASADIYYFGYRFYDPNLQRWPNRDPLGEYDGPNLYVFVGNNPICWIDAYGLHWTDYIPDALTSPGTVNFSAGLADHLSFGLTVYARQGYGIDDVVDRCSGAYGAGTTTGVAFDLVTTAGSLALSKAAAKVTARELAKDRRTARKVLDLVNGDDLVAHHINPLKGHPGGIPTLFPTAGLPSWLKNHPGNLEVVTAAGNTAAHQALRGAESIAYGLGLANPYAASIRFGLSAER